MMLFIFWKGSFSLPWAPGVWSKLSAPTENKVSKHHVKVPEPSWFWFRRGEAHGEVHWEPSKIGRWLHLPRKAKVRVKFAEGNNWSYTGHPGKGQMIFQTILICISLPFFPSGQCFQVSYLSFSFMHFDSPKIIGAGTFIFLLLDVSIGKPYINNKSC